MLYAHGSDLCHELELRHAMANCFEALMGALLLDGGIEVADKVFANTLFLENEQLKEVRSKPRNMKTLHSFNVFSIGLDKLSATSFAGARAAWRSAMDRFISPVKRSH